MKNKLIIGISGRKQSGKTTLSDYLYKKIKRKKITVKQYSFATILKDYVCHKVLGVPLKNLYGTDTEKDKVTEYLWDNLPLSIRVENSREKNIYGGACPRIGFMTSRELMQIVGTDIFRKYFDQNIWVNACLRQIKEEQIDLSIINDVRFHSEVDFIVKQKGIIIRLLRSVDKDEHPSEKDLDDYDFDFLEKDGSCCIIDNKELEETEKNKIAEDFILKIMVNN